VDKPVSNFSAADDVFVLRLGPGGRRPRDPSTASDGRGEPLHPPAAEAPRAQDLACGARGARSRV